MSLLARIPAVDRLLAHPDFLALEQRFSRPELLSALRAQLEGLRAEIRAGSLDPDRLAPEAIAPAVAAALQLRSRPSYRRVINATGVLLHTGLGRAPLAKEAVEALAATAGGAQRVEIELESGERGGREEGCRRFLVEVTGCEDACVVNNNAGATLLILAALARGRKVLISRGELVEIGGSFRIPDVMAESGALLTEVGTTNRTRLADYRRALDAEVGLLLKVHPSNYRIQGFTEEASLEELVTLGSEAGVPVVYDLGSGSLVAPGAGGLASEPLVRPALASGVDLVCFSGDKLLGGPQAGIVAGRREAVERCRRHPLFRALRPGRLVYTALEATLRLYARGEETAIPVLRAMRADPLELRRAAQRLARSFSKLPGVDAYAEPSEAQAGSGSLPTVTLPSWAVRLEVAGLSSTELARRLRQGEPAVMARIEDGAVLLDLRSLGPGEPAEVVGRVRALA